MIQDELVHGKKLLNMRNWKGNTTAYPFSSILNQMNVKNKKSNDIMMYFVFFIKMINSYQVIYWTLWSLP